MNAISKLITAEGLSDSSSFAEVIASQDKLWSDLAVYFLHQKERKRKKEQELPGQEMKIEMIRNHFWARQMLIVERTYCIKKHIEIECIE